MPILRAAALALLVAAGTAGWTGWSWWSATHDDSLRYSQTRDEVQRTAEQAVQWYQQHSPPTLPEAVRINAPPAMGPAWQISTWQPQNPVPPVMSNFIEKLIEPQMEVTLQT